jgi:cell division protein FtsL
MKTQTNKQNSTEKAIFVLLFVTPLIVAILLEYPIFKF